LIAQQKAEIILLNNQFSVEYFQTQVLALIFCWKQGSHVFVTARKN